VRRQTFRNAALLVFAILLLASWLFWQRTAKVNERVQRTESSIELLTRDLRASNRRAKMLEDLDALTINENSATRLDILRHLNLEQSELEFGLNSKSVQKVNGTNLYVRNFTIKAPSLSYEKTLETIDWLHQSGKVTLQQIIIKPGNDYGDSVDLELKGVLYGLEKKSQ
jgi:type II secretory pathway component PulJ